MHNERRPNLSAWLLAAAIAVGCKPPAGEPPICPAMVAAGRATEADTRSLPPDVWFSMLIPRFQRVEMEIEDEPRECSGQPIAVQWPDSMQDDPRARARRNTQRTRTDADLSLTELESGETLVWARIVNLENGDAVGPIALVRWVARGVEIRGIGSVQAPAKRARMRLEPLGEMQALVLESEHCAGESEQDCLREAQVLPLVDQRFVSANLVVDGHDTGPARFILNDRREEALGDGWIRHHEIRRRLAFEGGVVLVHESIRARDCDPRSTATPCEERLTANDSRTLTLKDNAFHTTSSAWNRSAPPR